MSHLVPTMAELSMEVNDMSGELPDEEELRALDAGADPREILQARVDAARADRDRAAAELRGLMSDDELLASYGIDLGGT